MGDATPEEWRSIAGYEGLYAISNLGRVRSFHGGRGKGKRGGLLRPGLSCGKLTVALCKDGTKKTRLVHQLVLEAFVGPRPPGMESLHGPGGALDNRIVNLRYGTPVENAADKLRDGTDQRGSKQGGAKLTDEIVLECRRRYAAGESQGVLAAEFGVSGPTVSNAITGGTWAWLPGAVPIDNMRHGKQGTAHHAAKLTPEIVREARRRNAAGESQYALAAEYGVKQPTLQHAISGYTWKHVT